MGSKSKSSSSTSTSNTDARAFQTVEQGLTGESSGLGSVDTAGSGNTILNDISRKTNFYDFESNVDLGDGAINTTGNVTVLDGGAIKAAEHITELALDAMSGGALSIMGLSGDIASMAFSAINKNNEATHASFNDVLHGIQTASTESARSVESILAEKQTTGDQKLQQYLIIGVVGMGALVVLMGVRK